MSSIFDNYYEFMYGKKIEGKKDEIAGVYRYTEFRQVYKIFVLEGDTEPEYKAMHLDTLVDEKGNAKVIRDDFGTDHIMDLRTSKCKCKCKGGHTLFTAI